MLLNGNTLTNLFVSFSWLFESSGYFRAVKYIVMRPTTLQRLFNVGLGPYSD